MSRRLPRHFTNNFPSIGQPKEDANFWRDRIGDILNAIFANEKRISKDCDGGLYVGLGGVGFAMWYLYKLFNNKEYLSKAGQYVNINKEYYNNRRLNAGDRLGFLLGKAGITALSAVIAKDSGEDISSQTADYVSCVQPFLQPDPLGCGSDEVLVGRAGYILGALWLREVFGQDIVPLQSLYQVCDVMLESGVKYSQKVKSPCPLMYQYYKTEYLGAAHGVCGILQAFLSVPGYLQHNPSAESLVRSSVDFYLSLQTPDGNFPCAMDELAQNSRPQEDELIHWCHGAPGAVYMLARAYLTWRDDRYLQSLLKAGDCTWKKGLLRKGPGICHGVAGSGYVFLLLYRLTGQKSHLYRAEKYGEFLFSEEFRTGARIPDCPFSLYEGWAGTACYLADLIQPQKAAFPFSNVVF